MALKPCSQMMGLVSKYRWIIIEILIIYSMVSFRSIQILERNGLDRNFDRALYHDYISHTSEANWLSRDWLAGGISTWSPPTGQYLDVFMNSIFSPLPAMYVLTMLVNLLNVMGIYAVASHFVAIKTQISLLRISAVAMSLIGSLYLAEVGSSFTNWSTLFFLFFSLHFLLRYKEKYLSLDLVLSGIFTGLAISFKFTNSLLMIGSLTSVVIINRCSRRRSLVKAPLTFVASVALGTMPNWIHWLKTWENTGNPLFPFYNALFKSAYFPALNFRDNRWKVDDIGDLRSFFVGKWGPPWNLELNSFDLRVPVFFTFLLLVLILAIRKRQYDINSPVFHLVLQILIGCILWLANLNYGRYFIPLEALIGFAIPFLSVRLMKINFHRVFLISLLFTSIAINVVPKWSYAVSHVRENNVQDRWESDMTNEIEKITGIVLISGAPNSFLALYGKDVKSFIRLDVGNIPEKFKALVVSALANGTPVSWVHTSNDSPASLQLLYTFQPFFKEIVVNLDCRIFVTPIYSTNELCAVLSSNNSESIDEL